MPLIELQIAPGIVTEETERGANSRWRDCNRVRFRQGLPEKLGGWSAATLTGEDIAGVPRSALDWRAIDSDAITGVGTSKKLYQIFGDAATNITPYRLATNAYGGSDSELERPFETNIDSGTESIVTVTHTSHGLAVGDTIYFTSASGDTVGGLSINGEFIVLEVTDANTYTFDFGEDASSADTGPSDMMVDYAYEISIGADTASTGVGWGAGPWNDGTWNTPRTSSGIIFPARTWALDTWGEDLVANPRNGAIYYWDKSSGFTDSNRAAIIHANAPAAAAFVLVSPVDRHLIAYGCTPAAGGDRNPLVIRWCSQNDFTSWTVSRTNTAGERRLDHASEIVSGLRLREEIAIFTDVSMLAQTYVGPPSTFNIRYVGGNCGLVGPFARAEFRGTAFWMSYEDFYYYDGSLDVLPCPIRNHVFDDLNRTQTSQFFCSVNSLFQEIAFFYCSADSDTIDRYAIFNVLEQSWYFGELARTAWLDTSSVRSLPAAFASDGTLYNHETGTSDNGAAMGEYLESWDFEIDPAGNNLMLLQKMVPDFLRQTGAMQVTLKARKYPHGEQVTKGPFDLSTDHSYIRPRIRGRQVAMRVQSDQDAADTDWRMGTWRADARPHGRR